MSADFYSLEIGSSNYLILFTINGLAQSTVWLGESIELKSIESIELKSEKFEMDLGRLTPASEVAEGHTLPSAMAADDHLADDSRPVIGKWR
jgi:hypothetical protein